jgi:hypothetical protein
MLSYNQELRMTLVYDDKVLTDPEYLFELFGEIWDATNAVLTEEDTMSELSSSFAHSASSNKGHRLSMASRTVPLSPPAEDEFDELYDPAYLKRRGQSDEHKVELD